jgi:hypothetical protein
VAQQQEQEVDERPAPAPEPTAPEPWADKLEQLAQMGFLNGPVLAPLLDRHNGSIIAVVAELLGQ